MEIYTPGSDIKRVITYGNVIVGGPGANRVSVNQAKLESETPSVGLTVGPSEIPVMIAGERGGQIKVTFR